MHRWRLIAVVLLVTFCAAFAGLASESWIRWYEHEDEIQIGTLLEMGGEYWLVGTHIVSMDPPDAGIVVFRVGPDGRLIGTRSYDWGGVQSAADALVTPDGNALFAGMTDQYGAVDGDFYVLQADASGQTLAEWVFGESLRESATRILMGSQGDVFIIGNQMNPEDVIADPGTPGYGGMEGRSAPYAVRMQPGGSPVWKEHYRSESNVIVFDAVPSRSGGCFVLSTVYGFPNDDDAIRLDRLDEDGTIMWSRTFGEGNSKGYALAHLSPGRLLIAGAQEDEASGNLRGLLILVEEFGREVWSRTYGDADLITTLHTVVETKDGLIVAAGSQLEDYGQYQDDVYLVCVGADGERQWEHVIPTGKHVTIEALHERSDGGLLIAGSGAIAGERFQAMLMFIDPAEAGREE